MAAQAALAQAQEALRRTVLAEPDVRRNVLEQARAAEGQIDTSTQAQVETDRAMYESVLRQIKDLDLAKDVQTNAASVIQQSGFPNQPVSPKPVLALGMGLGGGLALGLALVFALAALDRSIKTVDQAETTLGLPCLAAIPETTKDETASPGGDHAEAVRDKLVAGAPEGPVAEAFRNLRAALALLGPETERRVFLFASALPAEGKSFTSANYALALMQQGYRVLLIDGDLRRPTLHKIFPQTNPASRTEATAVDAGVADCLVGKASLKDAVRVVATYAHPLGANETTDASMASDATTGQLSLLEWRTTSAKSGGTTERRFVWPIDNRSQPSFRPDRS